MKTLEETINGKLEDIQRMFDEYYKLDSEMENCSYEKDNAQWLEYYDRCNKLRRKITTMIRSLVKYLGFNLRSDLPMSFTIWIDIFIKLRRHANLAIRKLHELDYNDSEYFLRRPSDLES